MEPESKKRRIDRAISRRVSSPAAKNDIVSTPTNIPTVPLPVGHPHPGGIHFRIEQAKRQAVAQAQQEGCTANFKIFDSQFGNFLLPVWTNYSTAVLQGPNIGFHRGQKQIC